MEALERLRAACLTAEVASNASGHHYRAVKSALSVVEQAFQRHDDGVDHALVPAMDAVSWLRDLGDDDIARALAAEIEGRLRSRESTADVAAELDVASAIAQAVAGLPHADEPPQEGR